jgi:nitroreductase
MPPEVLARHGRLGDAEGMTSERRAAAALAGAAAVAGLAPSVHNTQPWRWRVFRTRLDLFADRSRQLGVADPDGRLLMISCGAALHHARVALAAEGWQPAVARFPRGDDPDHLARLTTGEHVGVTGEATRLLRAAHQRRSDRRPVSDSPVPRDALAAVRAVVEAAHCHLHILQAEQVSDLAVAAARADELEREQHALRAELALWVGGHRPGGAGVPDTVIPAQASASPVPQRDFGRAGTLPTDPPTADPPTADPPADPPTADRAATYAVVFGELDGPPAWLRAGEALSAAWLTACERDMSLLPFTAPMELAATRTILRRLLAGLGHPYLVVRLGMADRGREDLPPTPRLSAAQTVEIVEADSDIAG